MPFALTPRAYGFLDALQGHAARPAPFGHLAGCYLAGYVAGVAAATRGVQS